jgi:hypothetical protein
MKAISRLRRRVANLSSHQAGVLLFVIAMLVRLAVIVHFRPYHDLVRYELERTAISLAHTGIYGNPYSLPTGPTAHVSPGYTLMLAALFRIFGTGTAAEIVKELLSSAVSSLEIALLPAVASALSLGRTTGILAGLVMAVYPARPMVEIDGDWEAPYMALGLMMIAVLAVQLWKRHDLRVSVAVRHGLYWGVALLFVAALLPLFLTFLVIDALFQRGQLKRYVKFAAVEVLAVAVCLLPWAVRNYHALGSPVITRTNAGTELRVSNNDYAVADQRENAIHGVFERYHPLQSPAEALRVRKLGELRYNNMAMQEAKQWIATHPERFVKLTLGRIRCFWFYVDPTSRAKTLFCWIVNVAGFAGLFFALRRRHIAGLALGLIVLIYPLPNYLVHVGLRQSYPMEWLMLLLGCALLTGVFTQARVLKQSHSHVRVGVPASRS